MQPERWLPRAGFFTEDGHVWTDPPGQRWENFVHKTDEVVMVVDGKVEFEIGGKLYHPQSGDELLIPSAVLHSVRNIESSTPGGCTDTGRIPNANEC